MEPRRRHRSGLLPVFLQNGPQYLIVVSSVAQKGPAQHALLQGTHLPQRRIAAGVGRDRARFETVDADDAKREIDDRTGAFLKDSAPPERRTQRKSPFGAGETRLQLEHLED